MRFTTREDIELPADVVFAAVSDFEGFERAALRRGAEVTRTGNHAVKAPGMGWNARFPYRGKDRQLALELARFDPPNGLLQRGRIGGMDLALSVDLLALAPRRTRLTVDLDLTPATLAARLFLQTLRLAKTSMTKRLRNRVTTFARDLEARHHRPTRG